MNSVVQSAARPLDESSQPCEFRRSEQRQYRVLFVITFSILLPIAAVARIFSWKWRPWPPGSNGYASVISEARSMARTVAGHAFRL